MTPEQKKPFDDMSARREGLALESEQRFNEVSSPFFWIN